jgi:hypothetical protein
MFSKSAAEGSAAANSVQAAAAALLSTAQTLPLSSCDGQALANTLWALATLGQRPPLTWLNRVLQHAEAAAARGFLSAQGVSMIMWALAALAVVPQAPCLSALLVAAQQHMRHMTPQGFSNILWALAVLERPPSKEWLSGFWPACRTLLPQMTSQGLVNCMWSAARLGLQPPQEWVGDVAGLLLERGVSSLTSQGLSNIVWAMSKISITCRAAHELLQSCLQQAVLVLQQQWQQHQQRGEQTANSSSSSSSSVCFNIYELSGLLHAVCCLRMREAAHHAAFQPSQSEAATTAAAFPISAGSGIGAAATEGSDLLGQLTLLLQEVSTPLLHAAGPTELSVMLWSQVAMPCASSGGGGGGGGLQPMGLQGSARAASPAAAPDATTSSSSSNGRPGMVAIPRKWMVAWFASTRANFSGASSKDLAFWVWCQAHAKVFKLKEDWMASWQVASFRQLGRASTQVNHLVRVFKAGGKVLVMGVGRGRMASATYRQSGFFLGGGVTSGCFHR